ncbi:MAG: flotillin-like FloA family protein [Veillonella sp.]|nr:flotillin-like FloA family protein [Veillonella sp.]
MDVGILILIPILLIGIMVFLYVVPLGLAGGDVDRVVDALIAAERASIPLTFERSAAIDLAGRDVLEAVQMSVNPKVIETPIISAVAKNGIELKVRARVTVRANIDRLVGGAGEATIIARVGEGIVTTVGSSEEHTDVLENPDHISRTVLGKGLDAGTAFEILSIDRRAMAVATEQEMRAKTQDMQAKVVEAQAEVPKALAEAFRNGNLGVMDYYNMNNIIADTKMRENLADGE